MSALEKTVVLGPARLPIPARRVVPAAGPPRRPAVGDCVFGFRLKRELGRGAFATVFLAEQGDLAGRPVVLKLSEIEGDEPRTLAQLQHTHIVPIHSVHEDAARGLRAVCMPYFGGAALAGVLEALRAKHPAPAAGRQLAAALAECAADPVTPGPLDRLRSLDFPRACAWVVARLAEALDHAHQRGVIHCDVKPSNVLLGSDGTPMLLDFNVSTNRYAGPGRAITGGTLAYMAPERRAALLGALAPADRSTAAGKTGPAEASGDLYSLGVVLYEMLTGALPPSPAPASPRARRADVPWTLESICRKCLAADPAARYHRAADLAEDLRRFLRDEPLRFAPELSRRERLARWFRRHPRVRSAGTVGLVAAVLLAGAGVALVSYRHHLTAAQDALDRSHAEERRRAYARGTVQALCLVNTQSELPSHLAQGRALCETTLALYDVLGPGDWQRHPDWLRLAPADRGPLAEDTRELLLMLAWAHVRGRPADPATARTALRLLDRAEGIDGLPPSRALLEDRARYLDLVGDAAGARAVRGRAETLPAATARDCYLLAAVEARRGRYPAAVALLDRAIHLNPRHYWALVQRGICHQELGQVTAAASDFGGCISLAPDLALGYFNRGCVFARVGQHAEAVADYTAAVRCDPDFVPAQFNRGLAHLELKHYPAALADFRALRAGGREDSSLLLGLGVALEGVKQHAAADRVFVEARARSAQDADELRLRHRWVYGFAVADRLPAQAAAAFDDVLGHHPRHPQALYGKAVLLVNRRQEAAALPALDQLIQQAPGFQAPRRLRATLLARRGDFARATVDVNWCLEQTAEQGPNFYTAACVAALAAGSTRDPALAEPAAGQALHFLDRALAYADAAFHFVDDPDLDGIRHQPQFQAWVQRKTHGLPPKTR